ncbi:glycine zipper 2TM domain-containing protein [Sphingomonas adhaesiva]|uniref:glycine zipper 2TM domain-containing protein n=1 Tax=Sphingomonas adhaesiva TaxID=28212 RepID=UPI002FF640A3
MLKKVSIGLGSVALATAALAPVAAQAQDYYYGDRHDARAYDDDGYRDHDRAYREAYRDGWNRAPRYAEYDRRGDDRDARYRYRRCQDGTVGTLVGALAGGLLGRTIDRRGDRTLGTVIGAGAGALAGNAVARADNPRGCSR